MKRQQLLNGPAMSCDAGGHRGGPLERGRARGGGRQTETGVSATVLVVPTRYMPCSSVTVWRASARQRRASGATRARKVALRRSIEAVWITPFLLVPPQRLDAHRCARNDPALALDPPPRGVALPDQGQGRDGARDAPGGALARRSARAPERSRAWRGGKSPGPRDSPTAGDAAPRGAPARSPPHHRHGAGLADLPRPPHRVLTILASAIHTLPPGRLTRRASACTGPRARGCAPRCGGPAAVGPCPHAATVRSSTPQVATIACTGPPGASKVTRRITSGRKARRRAARPCVAVPVVPHCVQMQRRSWRAWMPISPRLFGRWQARQLGAGDRTGVHAASPLLAVLGRMPRRRSRAPHFHYKRTSPRFSGELPPMTCSIRDSNSMASGWARLFPATGSRSSLPLVSQPIVAIAWPISRSGRCWPGEAPRSNRSTRSCG